MGSTSPGSKIVWLLTAVAAAVAVPATVQADTELGQMGAVGRHCPVDIFNAPGAVRDVVSPGNDSLGETWLRGNPPVMFARGQASDNLTSYFNGKGRLAGFPVSQARQQPRWHGPCGFLA